METAYLLIILGAMCVGVVSAIVRTWSLHARLYSLEDRVSVLEGVTSREVKIRAASERWKRPSKDEELLVAQLQAAKPPEKPKPWWETLNLPREYHG